jgi:hypothetical protein|tara:strand:- start:1862 stop:2251 length:390 start_codon:yes stop_codon:yes gene_type:complete
MKFQLFQQIPDEEFMVKILNCFGNINFNDNKEFSKFDLDDLDIINKLEDLIPELVMYYLPCKYNMFLTNININKCITILRQLLRLYNYKLKKREHVQHKKKKIYYHISKCDDNNIKIENSIHKCVLKFN